MKLGNGLKYLQIRDLLVDRFKKEEYTSGRKLPTEQALTFELGVSRSTVRQALDILESDGIIVRKHGSGTFFVGHAEPDHSGKTGLIGLINFFFMDYIYPEIIRAIEDTISAEGYSLALTNCNLDPQREIESVERLVEQGVKGLILEPSRNSQIDETHPMQRLISDLEIPIVTTHWGISNVRVSTVTVDDVRAGYEATRYLINAGHREIALVYKREVQAGEDRFTGYRRALSEADIPYREERVVSFNNAEEAQNFRQGYELTNLLLERTPRPTAIFYFNDHIAMQGYQAIQERGLAIPDDVSVIGFDNYAPTALLHPPLTTFEHPKYELGRWAAKLLLDEIAQPRAKRLPMKLVFESTLVERASVRRR
ncbi:MAG: substrate-binding domain-containing protein [Alkalispirochaeta sp.]